MNIDSILLFQLVTHERRLSTAASRTMAAMSLGFIVMVTPWTIQEVVAACTGSKPPPFLDFLATWLALSNSFWNPFLYWLLNNHFRRISRELLYTKVSKVYFHSHSIFIFQYIQFPSLFFLRFRIKYKSKVGFFNIPLRIRKLCYLKANYNSALQV